MKRLFSKTPDAVSTQTHQVVRVLAILYAGFLLFMLSVYLPTKSWIVLTLPLLGLGIATAHSFEGCYTLLWTVGVGSGIVASLGYTLPYFAVFDLQMPMLVAGYSLAVIASIAVAETHRHA